MGKLRSGAHPLTNLAADDWGPCDQVCKLVQHVVREGNQGLRAGKAQCRQAGPQLLLHGALAQHSVLEPEREGPLLQYMHQSEELVQVGVLGEDQGPSGGAGRSPGDRVRD